MLEGMCIDHQNPTVHVECEGAQNGLRTDVHGLSMTGYARGFSSRTFLLLDGQNVSMSFGSGVVSATVLMSTGVALNLRSLSMSFTDGLTL